MNRYAPLPTSGPWPGIARIIEQGESLAGLYAQRLGPLATHQRATSGRLRSPEEEMAELQAMAQVYSARRTLTAVVEALGEVVLFKGLALASRYPEPHLRPFGDLDVLVADAAHAHATLIGAGFIPCGPFESDHYEGLQHLQPLAHPDHGWFPVEVHDHVSWVGWSAPPLSADVIRRAVPSKVGIPGVLEPHPAQHALIVAAHSAGDMPLRCVGDLLDVDLLALETDPVALASVASAWSVPRLWSLYRRAADAVLYGATPPRAVRTWAPGLLSARDATVLERHLGSWLSPISMRRPRDIPRGIGAAILNDLRPADGETWTDKVARLRTGGRNLKRPLGEHTVELGDAAVRPRHRRREQDERVRLPSDHQH